MLSPGSLSCWDVHPLVSLWSVADTNRVPSSCHSLPSILHRVTHCQGSCIVSLIVNIFRYIVPLIVNIFRYIVPLIVNIFRYIVPLIVNIFRVIVPLIVNILRYIMPLIVNILRYIVPLIVNIFRYTVPSIIKSLPEPGEKKLLRVIMLPQLNFPVQMAVLASDVELLFRHTELIIPAKCLSLRPVRYSLPKLNSFLSMIIDKFEIIFIVSRHEQMCLTWVRGGVRLDGCHLIHVRSSSSTKNSKVTVEVVVMEVMEVMEVVVMKVVEVVEVMVMKVMKVMEMKVMEVGEVVEIAVCSAGQCAVQDCVQCRTVCSAGQYAVQDSVQCRTVCSAGQCAVQGSVQCRTVCSAGQCAVQDSVQCRPVCSAGQCAVQGSVLCRTMCNAGRAERNAFESRAVCVQTVRRVHCS
ncbi:hypothetical protein FHG87_021844 [Trinorchestia longiramus]|nr:hypothetical protein FHG87_021844 [Trinorchestia longiramus]